MNKKEAKAMLTNRKVYVNGKSKEIQEKLFEIGFKWDEGQDTVISTNSAFLYTNEDSIMEDGDMMFFMRQPEKEISAEEILNIVIDKEFHYGDILINRTNNYLVVYQEKYDSGIISYKSCYDIGEKTLYVMDSPVCGSYTKYYDLANQEEQQILFDALKKEGYCWNDENKLIERSDSKFKDGDILSCLSFIFIYKKTISRNNVVSDCYFSRKTGNLRLLNQVTAGVNEMCNYATEEEKQILFNALEKKGKYWNSEKKCIENTKFKNGDIVSGGESCTLIYRGMDECGAILTDCFIFESDNLMTLSDKPDFGCGYTEEYHLASDYEKESFFNELKYTGKFLNDNNVLEDVKIVTKVKHEFKPFDKVLVKDKQIVASSTNKEDMENDDYEEELWSVDLFSDKRGDKFMCVGGEWDFCIPFEGNEKLLGTNKDINEND
jgi:hypothetical protein